ncbi:uncharacterized protein BYT42DRAFT_616505 [Radiomyces spectabilis]|uniref:uncharacterized protein n=1 Tax=Radiomyces spectabilis TaxID=64574 RepID=UPI00221F81BD|nr:uncharacterized protein BYT42DRAFT_616505 [Radiomyces spectabilis]KAI8371411.1 hypothetical protein BYT42DRAFT_616505 [Radiomyces spectabilis]
MTTPHSGEHSRPRPTTTRGESPSPRQRPITPRLVSRSGPQSPARSPTISLEFSVPSPSVIRKRSTLDQVPMLQKKSSNQSFSSFLTEDSNVDETPWTRTQWKALENWYDKMNRDVDRTVAMFYRHEALRTVEENGQVPPIELWTKDKILWRCQCLDTNTKFHGGLLPSERKRLKKRKLEVEKPIQVKRTKKL